MRNHPDVLVLIHRHPVVVIGVERVFHVRIFPKHATFLAVNAHQLSEGRNHHHTLLRLNMSRHTKLFRKLFWAVAKRNMLQILRLGVKVIETVLVGLHPVVFLRVEMYALHIAVYALLVQPA